MAMLEVNHLAIQFGGLRAVDGFNVSIEKGQLYGLIGPNGAGKTTIFNLLTGVYKPTEGIIKLDGQDITGKSTIEINKAGIARTFQNIRLFKDMPVLDNVKVGLHNHHSYSTLTGILRLPKYHKVEKEMNEKELRRSSSNTPRMIRSGRSAAASSGEQTGTWPICCPCFRESLSAKHKSLQELPSSLAVICPICPAPKITVRYTGFVIILRQPFCRHEPRSSVL